jgi:hypothetical protein
MSEAFLMRRGGSVNNAYALVAVSYPADSTCTAAKGTKTLTARSSNGAYCFSIPEAGTWTITITDGTNTATQDVVISSAGQVEKVTLVYEYSLYNSGAGADNWTGAVSGPNDPTATKGSEVLELKSNAGNVQNPSTAAYFYTALFSLADYTELEITADVSISTNYLTVNNNAQICVVDGNYNAAPVAAVDLPTGNHTTVLSLPASTASGQYRVVIAAKGYYDEATADSISAVIRASRVRLL